MPEGSLKALLKLGQDLNNITNEKLEIMNSKNLLPYHIQRFERYNILLNIMLFQMREKLHKKYV
ncbi:hypothetical protein RMAECT_1380 [Rickettsia rhipicephali str. Ect]|uniref:Uncharacterized protein n=1 Tax=Rickettsia rhipicephali str. Ect TaxID=1359199 RepID=A0A0F3PGB1_RICRH|nr:hypothetical protein RMAECT_1380 [Rickettsia rhipicephali str. Ect]